MILERERKEGLTEKNRHFRLFCLLGFELEVMCHFN
jgi:hypothetical protein